MKKMTAFLTTLLMALSCAAFSVHAQEHTFTEDFSIERCELIAERDKELYMLGGDGVYYTTAQKPLLRFEPYRPMPGTVDIDNALQALARLHPEAKFAVCLESFEGDPSYTDEELRPFMDSHIAANGMTYTEVFETWQNASKEQREDIKPYYEEMRAAFNAYVKAEHQKYREEEAAHMEALGMEGITDSEGSVRTAQGILTAQEVLEFPGHEKLGYFLGLAPALESIPQADFGDVNLDGTIDILDVILLNKYFLGSTYLDARQRQCADCNRDGTLNASDSLAILKYVIGTIDSLETV